MRRPLLRLPAGIGAILLLLALTGCLRGTPASHNSPAGGGGAGPSSSATCTIPQNNGGDHDADNNGGPSDGDGCDL
jgi:hypothetical protein